MVMPPLRSRGSGDRRSSTRRTLSRGLIVIAIATLTLLPVISLITLTPPSSYAYCPSPSGFSSRYSVPPGRQPVPTSESQREPIDSLPTIGDQLQDLTVMRPTGATVQSGIDVEDPGWELDRRLAELFPVLHRFSFDRPSPDWSRIACVGCTRPGRSDCLGNRSVVRLGRSYPAIQTDSRARRPLTGRPGCSPSSSVGCPWSPRSRV